jgi:hypothetical protein
MVTTRDACRHVHFLLVRACLAVGHRCGNEGCEGDSGNEGLGLSCKACRERTVTYPDSCHSFFGRNTRLVAKKLEILKFCGIYIISKYKRRVTDPRYRELLARWSDVTKSVQGPLDLNGARCIRPQTIILLLLVALHGKNLYKANASRRLCQNQKMYRVCGSSAGHTRC